ncbi:MAG: hypothetical protein JWL77_6164 [Chthonomonadaceae bacterium]|nr:hypothetical protein [Chthonomonadaceae bacterium]
MRSQRGLAYGLALTTALCLALAGWTRLTPASAQNDPAGAQQPPPGARMGAGGASIAASGDFVYILRGPTLYQLKAADLSVVTQKTLPAPAAPGAPPAAP